MVRKVILLGTIFTLCSCSVVQNEHIKITGDTNYYQETNKSLHTAIHTEYKYRLYEPKQKNWGLFLEGKITTCYDHFGNEVKADGITTLGVSF